VGFRLNFYGFENKRIQMDLLSEFYHGKNKDILLIYAFLVERLLLNSWRGDIFFEGNNIWKECIPSALECNI